jgi:hypothetical protein
VLVDVGDKRGNDDLDGYRVGKSHRAVIEPPEKRSQPAIGRG